MPSLTLVDVNPSLSIAFAKGQRPTLTLVDLMPSVGVEFSDPTAITLELATIFKGETGEIGPKGDKGDTGPALTPFDYQQVEPASTWVVLHNLGRRPSVTTTDANGVQFYGAVTEIDANTLSIDFARPAAGFAYLN